MRKVEVLMLVFVLTTLANCATSGFPLRKSHDSERSDQSADHEFSAAYIKTIVVDSVPVLNTSDDNQSGFQLRVGIMLNGIRYKLVCAFDGLTKKKCVVYDEHDYVPIVIAADGHVLFYEPSGGVYLWNLPGWSISLGPSEDGISFGFEFQEKRSESHLSADLRTIVQRASANQIVEQIDQSRYRYLAWTEAGNRVEAIVNAEKKRYERLSIWIQDEEFINLKILTKDRPIAASSFGFPQIPDRLETILFTLPEIDEARLSSKAAGMTEILVLAYRLVNIRAAIRLPSKRKEVEEYLGEEFDWVALEERDNRISSLLQSLSDDFLIRFSSVINRYAYSDKSVFGRDAKKGFERYITDDNYKAFAQSASGAWGAFTGAYSTLNAVEEALERCVKYNEAESRYPCKIINVNNLWASEL